MGKFSLTTEGMVAYNAMLQALDAQQRINEALAASRDAVSYIAERFEIQVQQLELLRDSDESYLIVVGYSFAAVIAAGRPIEVKEAQDDKPGRSNCILASLTISAHCMDGSVLSAGGFELTLST